MLSLLLDCGPPVQGPRRYQHQGQREEHEPTNDRLARGACNPAGESGVRLHREQKSENRDETRRHREGCHLPGPHGKDVCSGEHRQ
jgi:hypothetical protein